MARNGQVASGEAVEQFTLHHRVVPNAHCQDSVREAGRPNVCMLCQLVLGSYYLKGSQCLTFRLSLLRRVMWVEGVGPLFP
jgi:hypothetical protein